MPPLRHAHYRWLFLSTMGFIYACAFFSWWAQYDGLHGHDGLLPADRAFVRESSSASSSSSSSSSLSSVVKAARRWVPAFSQHDPAPRPLLAWFAGPLGVPFDAMHQAAAMLGILGGLAACFGVVQHGLLFAVLWALYLGCYGIGRTFYTFQWDILLLEAGFATILYAPWAVATKAKAVRVLEDPPTPTVWPLRWLLFKLMFMSGAVKVQADCPTWKALTALEYHFATQCLPTPLAWWAHQLPPLVLRAGVALLLRLQTLARML